MEQFKGLPRLPTTAVPRRYELEFRPDLDACKFDGKMTTALDVVEETKYLVLNAADLVIKEKSVWLRGKDTTKELRERAHHTRSTIDQLQRKLQEKEIELEALQKELELQKIVTGHWENRAFKLLEKHKTIDAEDYDSVKSELEQLQVLFASSIGLDAEDEILVLEFEDALPHGEAILGIEFQGTLNDQLKGFYRSTYLINGEKRNMAVTQFEAADARRCFPCWDEPACKATFKITVQAPVDRVVLSNMPSIGERIDGAFKIVSFEESPLMSTYLVAIVVGEFDYIEGTSAAGDRVRVYTEVGKTSQGKFALDVALLTLPFYAKYFGTPYSLPKLDMIAIPDFALGAMENYGLVTYRETALLYDENNSAPATKQGEGTRARLPAMNSDAIVAVPDSDSDDELCFSKERVLRKSFVHEWKILEDLVNTIVTNGGAVEISAVKRAQAIVAVVVAHELAHQWFGNLVTMEWWTHLWLNEGFATWVSYLAVDHLFPEWKFWTQFNDCTMEAFKLDGLVESHPIEVEVHHAKQIDEIFDAISYSKGASLIRMLESYIGAQCFQKGLVSYIKRYACKNARTEDLWAVLSEQSEESVNELMDSWTKQKGYPVVIAKLIDDGLELEQSQYLSSGAHGDGQWVVPITLCYGSYEVRKNTLLHGKVGGVNLADCKLMEASSESSWIKLNVGQTAFYRVQYDDVMAARLRSGITAGLLDATDRFGILDDTYALCSACKQPLSALLSLIDVYRKELDYTVLSCLMNVGYKVVRVVSDAIPDSAPHAKLFIINLLQFAAEKLGWDPIAGESHLDAMLRGEILTALVELGHEETKQEGLRRFNIFLNDRSTQLLPADVRKAAYIAAIKNVTASDKSAYESLLNLYRETDTEEKERILGSLASSPDPSIVREALDFSLSPEVRKQDAVTALWGTFREGRETAWLWFKENWDFIWKHWGSGSMISYFVSNSVYGFASEEKADEIQTFFSTRMAPSIERTVSQSIERIRINARWVKNVQQEKSLEHILQELAHRK